MRDKTVQKKTASSETSRMRIMGESIKLFASKGYAATSIKDISRAAEVNIAAVNYHFESKENLYKQLLNKFAETGITKIQQILKPPKNVDEFKVRLKMFLSSGIGHIVEYPDLPRINTGRS